MGKYAYVIIHFGLNPVYLELELYFLAMLSRFTDNNHPRPDIVYMYSITDTPTAFIKAIKKFANVIAIPFDDAGITYNVPYKSKYTHFNLLRVCNFIFAYTLTQYDKVCIIEADMVLMEPINTIFELQTPAALTYYTGLKRINQNFRITTRAADVLAKCNDTGRLNGGIMLIKPDMEQFRKYVAAIPAIVQKGCKYPNETLFEYVNRVYYNLPVMYNFSHYHLRRMHQYPLSAADIKVYHFNETTFKHLDTIKTPIDEKGVNWLEVMATSRDPKYALKWVPISHYLETVYTPYHNKVEKIMSRIRENKSMTHSSTLATVVSPPCKPGKCTTGERCNRKTRKCTKIKGTKKKKSP